jgi:hypothetical protein
MSGGEKAITCYSSYCARFGYDELDICRDSNNNTDSSCHANRDSFKLPAAKGSEYPSINGGEKNF